MCDFCSLTRVVAYLSLEQKRCLESAAALSGHAQRNKHRPSTYQSTLEKSDAFTQDAAFCQNTSQHLISNDLHLNQCCFNKVTIIRTLHKMVPYSSKWSSETGRQYFSSSSLSSSRDMDPSLSPSTPRYAEAIAFQLSVIFARKMSSTWQNHSGFDSTDYISTCM